MTKLILKQIALSVALLIAADAILWVVAPARTERYAATFHQNLPGLRSQVEYKSFAGGLRSLALEDLTSKNGDLRVLCVGASTTEQSTQSIEDTWCAVLESRLKALRPEWAGRFHTLSYGAGGLRTYDALAWLLARAKDIQPDVVITLLGINDLTWGGGRNNAIRDVSALLSGTPSHPSSSNPGAEFTGGWKQSLKEECFRLSQLCQRAKAAWTNAKARVPLIGALTFQWHSANLPKLRSDYQALPAVASPTRSPDPFLEFDAATDQLVKSMRGFGAEVIVLGQPVLWKPDLSEHERAAMWFPVNTADGFVRPSSVWLSAEMRRYNDAQRDIAMKHGVSFVDLDAAIPKSLDYYFDDCHFTDKGSHAVAEAILPALQKAIAAKLPKGK